MHRIKDLAMYICPVNKKLAQNDNEYGHALISIEPFISSGSFRLSPLNLPLDAKWLCIVETMRSVYDIDCT